MTDSNQIQIFQSDDGSVQLDIKLEQDTLWLTQLQMSELFGTTPENVLMHLKNIFKNQELGEDRTTKDFLVVRQEGKRQVNRSLKHYSLDAIISVGYRVSSARATQFRIWATQILKQHLVQGYTLNQKRLQEQGLEFEQVVQLLSQTLGNQQLVSAEGVAVLAVVSDYARSWSLLQAYDEQSLSDQTTKQDEMQALALLVAESKPEQKTLIIRLVQQFILLKD